MILQHRRRAFRFKLEHEASKDISGLFSKIRRIDFSTDGSHMLVSGDDDYDMYRYDLSTPWDVATATAHSAFNIGADNAGACWSADGLRVFLNYGPTRLCKHYSTTTPWKISDLSLDKSVSIGGDWPGVPQIRQDDESVLILSSGIDIKTYSISGTTATLSNTVTDVYYGIHSKSDGRHILRYDIDNNTINIYSVSPAWSLDFQLKAALEIDTPSSFGGRTYPIFSYDKKKIYMIDAGASIIHQYAFQGL